MVAQQKGGNVVISEINEQRISIAKNLGFDTVNPSQADVGKFMYETTGQKGADVIFEVSGSQAGVHCMTAARRRSCPNRNGRNPHKATTNRSVPIFLARD